MTIIFSAEVPSIAPVKILETVLSVPYKAKAMNIDMMVKKVLSLFRISPIFTRVQYINS